MVSEPSIVLFRHSSVVASQTSFNVRYWYPQFGCCESCRKYCICIALHNNHIRLLAKKLFFDSDHSFCCLLRVSSRAYVQVLVWLPKVHIVEDRTTQSVCVMLTGMKQKGINTSWLAFVNYRCKLDDFGSCPKHDEWFQVHQRSGNLSPSS